MSKMLYLQLIQSNTFNLTMISFSSNLKNFSGRSFIATKTQPPPGLFLKQEDGVDCQITSYLSNVMKWKCSSICNIPCKA